MREKRENHPAGPVMRSLMGTNKMFDDLDVLIAKLETGTGMKISRSRFIRVLIEEILNHGEHIDAKAIFNDQTLGAQLAKAIARGITSHPEKWHQRREYEKLSVVKS